MATDMGGVYGQCLKLTDKDRPRTFTSYIVSSVVIKAFFSSVASRNENDYLTLRRLNYLFITVYHLLSLSPHLWPLDFSQWLYKFLFHLKASEHLFSSWVDLSIFFSPAYRQGTSMHPFSP